MSSHFQEQIATLRAEIQRREAEVVKLQGDVRKMEREIEEFQSRYDRVVGVAQTRLDAVKAAIDDLSDQRRLSRIGNYNPQESWTPPPDYISVEEQYRRAWTPSPSVPAPEPRPSPRDQRERLKQLYYDLVRRFHPDHARNEEERARRTEIMSHINEAYETEDFDTLEVIAAQKELKDDSPLAALTVRQLRKTRDNLLDEIEELKRERDTLYNSKMMRLKLDEKVAKMRGRDLLREMAQRIDDEYFRLMRELDDLRRDGF
jgi:hypothetical protein